MNYFFTADEHYGHKNVIEYCDRPFDSIHDMDKYMIEQNNAVVSNKDVVVHVGDFSLASRKFQVVYDRYIQKLNGKHIFIPGSHDHWMKQAGKVAFHSHIWEKRIEQQAVVCCHYAMRKWPKSHYGSWLLFGHSHGHTNDYNKSFDVGVDSHEFKPWPFEEIKEKMANKPFEQNHV